MERFDRVVLGVGGVGSAALWHLTHLGARTLGIEQHGVAHALGSSHGATRIIRQAYFEHPNYVPLLRRAYTLWEDLEARCGEQLFFPVGLVEIGQESSELIRGVRSSAEIHRLPIETLSRAELSRRFPILRLPEGAIALFEPTAGVLRVEACVAAQVAAGRQAGAELWTETQVHAWENHQDEILLKTSRGDVLTGGIIVCAGAWAANLFREWLPLHVVRKHLHWYPAQRPEWDIRHPCPAFFYQLDEGYFYGFPALDSLGVKVAEHSGGEPVADPAHVDRSPALRDRQRVRTFIDQCLIGVGSAIQQHAVCMYTLTPDHHFVVDRHPDQPQVVVAAGLSGHGFKFAPVLGEALAQLSLEGQTTLPIEFLKARPW